ncbi:DinB family protein [Salicibibacter halophilus]|uniref:DinB family protein n=1 Tax=Salicibibacter halophilus TaxID=2502791 RepID=A0A514LFQ9_9BACI|nr:DinB family protein [Salicibibacter halophilus]QDI90692.1 DinB family protein [Salicibibacter halophilus]
MNHLTEGLYGETAHVNVLTIFDGLDEGQAGEVIFDQQSIWQLLNHMIYWQDYVLRLLKEEETVPPKHASETWPSEVRPLNERAWLAAVDKFTNGLHEAVQLAKNEHGDSNSQEHLISLISHNSYHAGQVVFIRRYLDQWPPPSGGDTW